MAGAPTRGGDAALLARLHESGLAERTAGRVALERAVSDEVRRLGRTVLDDHASLDAGVVAVAEDLGVELPENPADRDQGELARTVALSGHDFDAAWLASQVAAHRRALALAQRVRHEGSHADVRMLGEGAAPVLARHLDEALAVATKLGVTLDETPVGEPTGTWDRAPSGGQAAGAAASAALGPAGRLSEVLRSVDRRSLAVGIVIGMLLGRRSRRG